MTYYHEMRPFRFWCQKVLPLVYDDSLSYYELLCKLVDYVNHLNEDVNNLLDEYRQVMEYFDNLDLQEEIDNKLDKMAEDGTLDAIIARHTENTFSAIRRKLLPITGQLRLLSQDDRIIHNRVSNITEIKDDENYPDMITGKQITFFRGRASYKINFNKNRLQRFGFILSIRGYNLNESYLYGPYEDTGNEEWRVYANGRPVDPFDFGINDEFVDLLIYKRQDTNKYLVTHIDTTGIHIYYNYPEVINNTGNLPRIRPYNVGSFETIFRIKGIELQTPTTGTQILTIGSETFVAGEWYKFDILL